MLLINQLITLSVCASVHRYSLCKKYMVTYLTAYLSCWRCDCCCIVCTYAASSSPLIVCFWESTTRIPIRTQQIHWSPFISCCVVGLPVGCRLFLVSGGVAALYQWSDSRQCQTQLNCWSIAVLSLPLQSQIFIHLWKLSPGSKSLLVTPWLLIKVTGTITHKLCHIYSRHSVSNLVQMGFQRNFEFLVVDTDYTVIPCRSAQSSKKQYFIFTKLMTAALYSCKRSTAVILKEVYNTSHQLLLLYQEVTCM